MGWKVAIGADLAVTWAEADAVVERKRFRVAARGNAIGLKKVRYMLEILENFDQGN